MKNLFGKVLVGAAGLVMALGMTAFAANTIEITGVDPDKETGKVTISGTITADAASPESTILVVPEGTSLATLEDAQIKYIDQETAASGEFSYEFVLETGKKYTVWCGGTDVAAPDDDVIDLVAGEVSGDFKVVGTVKVEYEGEDADKTYGDVVVSALPITGTDADGAKTYGKAITGTVSTDSKEFTVEVPAGKYDITVGKPGYLLKTVADVDVAADMTLEEVVELIAGDIFGEGDGFVNVSDLSDMLTAIGAAETDENYDAKYDVNNDGNINISDVSIVLLNISKHS